MPRGSPRDGIIILQVADKEPAVSDVLMARSAFLSYNYTGDNKMIVEARRVIGHNPGADLQTDAGGVRHDVPVEGGEEFPLVDTGGRKSLVGVLCNSVCLIVIDGFPLLR